MEKCLNQRTKLGIKRYELSKIDVGGLKSLVKIKALKNEINDLVKIMKKLECDGISFMNIKTEPHLKKKRSSSISKSNLPPKKRHSSR
jgi:hypothetical protein